MIRFPNVQKKAQEEVDRATGGKRLPEYDDQESLPYIQGACSGGGPVETAFTSWPSHMEITKMTRTTTFTFLKVGPRFHLV